MVSLSASEMDAFYKHELKMEHKEKMIASVKEQMARIQKQLDEESTDIHSLSLSRLSREEQGRLEQKLLRNEIFAAYAAKHRMKTQEREETKKRAELRSAFFLFVQAPISGTQRTSALNYGTFTIRALLMVRLCVSSLSPIGLSLTSGLIFTAKISPLYRFTSQLRDRLWSATVHL